MSNLSATASPFRAVAPQAPGQTHAASAPRTATATRAAGTSPVATRNATRTIAVTGGKGGVGKTNLSVALAMCAARAGLRVGILDADFGLAKLHILLGLTPQADLRDVLAGRMQMVDTLLEGPGGISILPGASGLAEMANLSHEQREMLLHGLQEVSERFDLLLLDTGAGIAENVLSFVVAADEALVVTSPEPTALADAYGLIKVTHERRQDLPYHLLVNNAISPMEADAAARRLQEVTQRFLNVSVTYAGRVPNDALVRAAVRARKPFLSHAPDAPASLAFRPIAAKLLGIEDISLSMSAQAAPTVAPGAADPYQRPLGTVPSSVMPAEPVAQSFVQRLGSLLGMNRRT